MFYDAIVNSAQITEQAECLLRDWKKEHEGYYAHYTMRIPYGADYQFEASCGFSAIPGGGVWLTSGNNFHAISINGTIVRITFAGRRHGMRPEFRELLKAASVWSDYCTLSYQTQESSWLPWETRDDRCETVFLQGDDAANTLSGNCELCNEPLAEHYELDARGDVEMYADKDPRGDLIGFLCPPCAIKKEV